MLLNLILKELKLRKIGGGQGVVLGGKEAGDYVLQCFS